MPAKYEVYGGNPIPPHPYQIDRVKAYGVSVNGDYKSMQDRVNATLNGNKAHNKYQVAASKVFITFMRMESMRSKDDPNAGSFSEDEVNVTFIVINRDTIKLALYMPYIWLNSGTPLISGRDVYGYPKQFGEIVMPDLTTPHPAADFKAEAEVLPTQGPISSKKRTVIRIRRDPPGPIEPAKDHSTTKPEEALDILEGSVVGKPVSIRGLPELLSPIFDLNDLTMAWMRQLASIENPDVACFRSTAEAKFALTGFRGAGLLNGRYLVDIPHAHSVGLGKELGLDTLPNCSDLTCQADKAYWMDFDFALYKGKDVWVAP